MQLLTAGVVDAGGKLRLCIGYKTSAVVPGHRRSQISRIYIDRRDTGGKFAAGVNDAGGSLSLIRYQQQGFINDKISDCRDLKLNIVLVEKAIFQWKLLLNNFAKYEKSMLSKQVSHFASRILIGSGKDYSCKNLKQKSCDTIPLKGRFSRSFTKWLYIKQLYPGHRLVLVHLANFKVCRESAEIFPSVIDLPVQMAAASQAYGW